MPGPIDQFILTPNLAEHAIKLQKARQKYKQELQNVFQVPLGSPISTNKDIIDNFTRFVSETLPTLEDEQIKQSCIALQGFDTKYKTIIDSISPDADTEATYMSSDIVTQKNAQLQKDVLKLTQERDSFLEDQQVSELRNTVLRSGNVAVSNHQVYMLGRPLRPASIPYLWTLSVLYIGIGLLIFYMFFPYRMPPMDILLFDIALFFKNPQVWMVLFSGASIVIFFLVLRITGVI
jgi:hypothetical protein